MRLAVLLAQRGLLHADDEGAAGAEQVAERRHGDAEHEHHQQQREVELRADGGVGVRGAARPA
eukprot:5960798-Alexandrium_andersonii.AAC.1